MDDEIPDDELRRWRLHSQRLVGPAFTCDGEGAARAVRWSGAVQSQDHQPALWSLARRCCGPDGLPPPEREVAAAFDAGAFLRVHVLRPTWHYLPPDRYRALIALSGPRLARSLRARWTDLGLPEELRARAAAVLVAAIRASGPLTRAAGREVLERAGIDVEGQRMPHLLMAAELDGVLTSGPNEGREATWALVEDRVPPAPMSSDGVPAGRDGVVADLVLTFVRSHAPATERDLAWWSGLSLTDVRAGLAAAGAQVSALTVRGRRYWHAGAPPPSVLARPAEPAVHLVQSYDEYLVAHTESRALADPYGFAPHMPRGAVLGPSLLVDGALTGRWRRVLTPGRVDVVVTTFAPLPAWVRRGLEAEAERYAAFVERPLRLVVEPLTPGG
jgi:hypothetical protein